MYTALLMHNREDTLFSTLPKEVLLQGSPSITIQLLPACRRLRAAAAAPSSSSSNPAHRLRRSAFDARAAALLGSLLACVSGGSAHDDDEDEADAMREPTTETGRLSASWVSPHVASAAAHVPLQAAVITMSMGASALGQFYSRRTAILHGGRITYSTALWWRRATRTMTRTRMRRKKRRRRRKGMSRLTKSYPAHQHHHTSPFSPPSRIVVNQALNDIGQHREHRAHRLV